MNLVMGLCHRLCLCCRCVNNHGHNSRLGTSVGAILLWNIVGRQQPLSLNYQKPSDMLRPWARTVCHWLWFQHCVSRFLLGQLTSVLAFRKGKLNNNLTNHMVQPSQKCQLMLHCFTLSLDSKIPVGEGSVLWFLIRALHSQNVFGPCSSW